MKAAFACLFFFISLFLGAQNPDLQPFSRFIAGINGGTIWGHNPPVYHLAHSHPLHYWLEYQVRKPQKEWSRAWSHPLWGFGIKYLDFRSPVLGKSIVALTYLEPRLFSVFTYRIGTGFSVQTHPFNSDNNSTNLMLGSHLAFVMHLQFNCYLPAGKNSGFRMGWGLTHLSNGAFSQPNSGVNSFFLSAGWFFRKPVKAMPAPDSTGGGDWKKGFDFLVSTSAGLVEKFPVGGPKYPVYQIHGRLQYRIGRKSSLAAGLDWKNNTSVEAYLDENPALGRHARVLGFAIGHELHISSVSLVTEAGWYVWKHHDVFPGIYQRYGLRKYWSDHCFSGIYLSTHRAKAECLEWTLGYKFSSGR